MTQYDNKTKYTNYLKKHILEHKEVELFRELFFKDTKHTSYLSIHKSVTNSQHFKSNLNNNMYIFITPCRECVTAGTSAIGCIR